MAQYTNSVTIKGVTTSTTLDTTTDTQTITVTLPTGQVATATQPGTTEGILTTTTSQLASQFQAQGVTTFDGPSVVRGVRSTATDVVNQSYAAQREATATNTSPPAEKQAIPVSTTSDAAVPQPQNVTANTVPNTDTATSPSPVPNQSALPDPQQQAEWDAPPPVEQTDFFQTEGEAPPLPQRQEAVDVGDDRDIGGGFNPASIQGVNEAGAAEAATKLKAQEQQTLGARLKTPTNGDWRFRISLAASDYLYNDSTNTLLAPLKATNGVIFPYTPTIETSYKANYDTVDLTHSNYRGYFYKNSFVDAVSIRGTFTAQDTREASYLLAVIHFFRSVTKMFYGQDPAYRGSPPPLVFLTGLGQYQFNGHPCLVSNFAYSLPTDVDYVRVDPNNYGLNMLAQKTPAFTGAGNLLSAIKARLTSVGGLPLGGIFQPPVQNTVNQTVNTTGSATYVPTKMEISLNLLPVQSRSQVSQEFSLKDFANGNQLKGGFW